MKVMTFFIFGGKKTLLLKGEKVGHKRSQTLSFVKNSHLRRNDLSFGRKFSQSFPIGKEGQYLQKVIPIHYRKVPTNRLIPNEG